MDARKLADFDRMISTARCLREDVLAACRALHMAAQRIERGDFSDTESLSSHYDFIIDTHADLGSKLQKLGVASGAIYVVPAGNNGKVTVAS